jgi:magnesium-transporting ATPase (P-type)
MHIYMLGWLQIKEIPSNPRETELAKYVLDVNVFARVAPEHKLRIVRALKETHKKITSMTGDGTFLFGSGVCAVEF